MEYDAFKDDWRRTRPDFNVYIPQAFAGSDYENQHLLVNRTPGGDLLAFWTAAMREGHVDQHVRFARSSDHGQTWTAPDALDGPEDGTDHIASWAFPVFSRSGRIYCFWNKHLGHKDYGRALTGVMRCAYSDDDGHTWLPGGDLAVRRTDYDHPDPAVPCNWIVWQNVGRDSRGRILAGFTRRNSPTYFADCLRRPQGLADWKNWWWYESRCEFMRFDNIDDGPDPQGLQITFLPDDATELRVPHPGQPVVSYAQEPATVLLPDGRLFMVMRTWTGRIYYSVSEDDGHTWRQPEVLRHRDNGADMLQPKSGCPLYQMTDGRFLLFYHHNDGTAHGGDGPGDYLHNRWPLYIALGEFRPDARQPVWFSRPKEWITTDGIGKPPTDDAGMTALNEVGDYTSFTEDDAGRILWYPDRKHFLLGKIVTDEFLADMAAQG
jgi:hypothetical protein